MTQTDDKFLNIIKKSGHNFHLQVSNLMKELGWSVENSQYYNDPDSDKAREIDIIGTKEFLIRGEKLVIKLFIDCKYVKAPAVFWFQKKNEERAIKLAKDNPILDDKDDYYLTGKEKHHYLNSNEVAWQWSQENNDIFIDAQHKVLKALIFFSEHQNSQYYEIRFPIIIVNDLDLLAKKDESDIGYTSLTDNFQLEINYSYKGVKGENITKYFLIDIVSYKLLEKFLKYLDDNDISLLKGNLNFDLRQRERQERENQEEYNPDPYF